MVFGNWYCPTCERWLVVGTVAPLGVMHRHLKTKRHRKLAAEKAEREQKTAASEPREGEA